MIRPHPGGNDSGNAKWDVIMCTPGVEHRTYIAVTVEDYIAAGLAAGVLNAMYYAGFSGMPQYSQAQLEEVADILGSVLAGREGDSTAERGLRTEIAYAYTAGKKQTITSQGAA